MRLVTISGGEPTPSLAAAGIGKLAALQSDDIRERLHYGITIEQLGCFRRPIRIREEHIAIEPCDLRKLRWNMLDCDVEQPFLLPHHVASANTHQACAIRKLKRSGAERALHHNQRHAEPLLEDREVSKLGPIAFRIVVASNRAEVQTHCPV